MVEKWDPVLGPQNLWDLWIPWNPQEPRIHHRDPKNLCILEKLPLPFEIQTLNTEK